VLDTSTARVIGGSSGDIAKTKAIEELLGKGIDTEKPAVSPDISMHTSSGISKGLQVGSKFEFDNIVYEDSSSKFKIKLLSMEVLANGRSRFNFLFTHDRGSAERISLQGSKERTYIATSDGEQIEFYSASGFTTDKLKDLQPQVPYKFSVDFAKIPPLNKDFSIVLSLYWGGYGNSENVFRGLKVSK